MKKLLPVSAHESSTPEDERPGASTTRPSRRSFLKGSLATGVALIAASFGGRRAYGADDYGVASGDPKPQSVVLWTRVPESFQRAGGVVVNWEVSTSPAFGGGDVVSTGSAGAAADADFTLRVRAGGLTPFTTYYYRFTTDTGYVSVVGRTLTAPASGETPEEIRLAFVTCNNRNSNGWSAFEALAQDDIHYCAHVGDAIYEGSAQTLPEYWGRHKLYLGDLPVREVRRLFPWIYTWDDHECFNNYAGADMTPEQRARQTGAYQAYSHYMPLDPSIQPITTEGVTELRIYREVPLGGLLSVFATDGRQYRDGLPCDRDILIYGCTDLYDKDRTMLGQAQTDWLKGALAGSQAKWKFVLSGTMMMTMKIHNPLRGLFSELRPGLIKEVAAGVVINLDQWDGFPANREDILRFVKDANIQNLVVLTGDIHNAFAGHLKVEFGLKRSENVGVEIMTPSISSTGMGEALGGDYTDPVERAVKVCNPHVEYMDGYYHGYTRIVIRGDAIESTYVAVDTLTDPDYAPFELARFRVEDGISQLIREA